MVKQAELHGDGLTAVIGMMHEENQRFDHLGHVETVRDEYSQRNYLSRELFPAVQENRGMGICNEFCASVPIGYDKVPLGEWFLKPGCGLMKKTSGKYSFERKYEFIPVTVKQKITEKVVSSEADFVCGSYAMHYEKSFCMMGRELLVAYRIENRGSTVLDWQEYAHNFFLPCGTNVAGLHISSGNIPVKNWTRQMGDDILKMNGKLMEVKEIPKHSPLYVAELLPNQEKGYICGVYHPGQRCGVFERGDFTPAKFKLWISENCVCPEVFLNVSLEAGGAFRWQRSYLFV